MQNADIKKLKNSEVEIAVTIPTTELEVYKKRAATEASRDLKIPGFRPGNAPEHVVLDRVGQEKIMTRAAEIAIKDIYPKILSEHKIEAIGSPEITITKIADGNPLEFRSKQAILPTLILPDYKKIAADALSKIPNEDILVTDVEIDTVLSNIQKKRSATSGVKEETGNDTVQEGFKIDDTFAKSLGKFNTLDELKLQVKKNLELEKKRKQKDKRRLAVIELILTKTEIDPPSLLIENELERNLEELKIHIREASLDFAEYLRHIKKTEDNLKEAWREDAIRRVQINLLLSEIAKKEALAPNKESVQKELAHLKTLYPDEGEERMKNYVENTLLYEEVYKLLENNKK